MLFSSSFFDILDCLAIEIWAKRERIYGRDVTVGELFHTFDDVTNSRGIWLKLRRICIISQDSWHAQSCRGLHARAWRGLRINICHWDGWTSISKIQVICHRTFTVIFASSTLGVLGSLPPMYCKELCIVGQARGMVLLMVLSYDILCIF